MRLKTELWIKAYLRTCAAAGSPAVVVHHGDDDAGAIFIKIARLDGTARLFGPAPASLEAEPIGTDRRFTPHLDGDSVTEADIEAYLARQLDFDRDLWVVEVEDRQGRHFLDPWLRG